MRPSPATRAVGVQLKRGKVCRTAVRSKIVEHTLWHSVAYSVPFVAACRDFLAFKHELAVDLERTVRMKICGADATRGRARLRETRLRDQVSAKLEIPEGLECHQGLEIKVAFHGVWKQSLTELSGGQKSLVAMALIFAVQRCDPAPFYLFDEIDAALDASYRSAVADLISRQAKEAQFITTTFRAEMVEVATRWHGIALQGGSSKIVELGKEEALGFVQGAA